MFYHISKHREDEIEKMLHAQSIFDKPPGVVSVWNLSIHSQSTLKLKEKTDNSDRRTLCLPRSDSPLGL